MSDLLRERHKPSIIILIILCMTLLFTSVVSEVNSKVGAAGLNAAESFTMRKGISTSTPVPSSDPSHPMTLHECTKDDETFARQPIQSNVGWKDHACSRIFDRFVMVLVPSGTFRMGGDVLAFYFPLDGTPLIEVPPGGEQRFEKPFWIDAFEVSNTQYGTTDEADLPVVNIRWTEARNFCAYRGGRLPTESEWEYAARGPSGLYYPWGDQWVDGSAIFAGNSSGKPMPIGNERGASWVGASDLLGNVEEWTSSKYLSYPYDKADGRESDNNDWLINRALRGGSWKSVDVTGAFLRAADRSYLNAGNRTPTIGFRCVVDLQ